MLGMNVTEETSHNDMAERKNLMTKYNVQFYYSDVMVTFQGQNHQI